MKSITWTLVAAGAIAGTALMRGSNTSASPRASIGSAALQSTDQASPSMLITLGGDARHDLARTLTPLDYSIPNSSSVLHLKDAIYEGATGSGCPSGRSVPTKLICLA